MESCRGGGACIHAYLYGIHWPFGKSLLARSALDDVDPKMTNPLNGPKVYVDGTRGNQEESRNEPSIRAILLKRFPGCGLGRREAA